MQIEFCLLPLHGKLASCTGQAIIQIQEGILLVLLSAETLLSTKHSCIPNTNMPKKGKVYQSYGNVERQVHAYPLCNQWNQQQHFLRRQGTVPVCPSVKIKESTKEEKKAKNSSKSKHG